MLEKLAEKIYLECQEDGEPVTKEEALEMAEMELKAKKVKHYERSTVQNQKKKPKTVKISEEKQRLFKHLAGFLAENGYNYEVVKENKLFCVWIGDKKFKIDLIQQRK